MGNTVYELYKNALITPQFTAPFSSQTSSSVHSVCCFWLLSTNLRDHSYITSAKDWVGGSRKWPVLLTFNNATIYSDIVSEWGSKRVQNYADVI